LRVPPKFEVNVPFLAEIGGVKVLDVALLGDINLYYQPGLIHELVDIEVLNFDPAMEDLHVVVVFTLDVIKSGYCKEEHS
jgi:hypothetical protein